MSKFKYVSLFSGIGGFDHPLNELGGECVLASEIDEFASKGYEALYNHKPEGDVTKIEAKDVQDHDLLVGGFPCFKRGTLVTTKEGLKKIEEIKKGDMVLTHKNRYKKVVVPMVKKKKGIYKLKVQGSPKTYVTEEHPIYVRTVERVKNEEGLKEVIYGEPEWVRVKDIDIEKHFVAVTSNFESENEMELDETDLWLMGRYMADGYVQDSKRAGRKNSYNRKVILCVGKDKLLYFKENAGEKYNITYSDNGNVVKCIITNERLMNLCKDIGRGAHNKEIPGYILNLPKQLLEIFLDGYMSGDGGVRGDTKYAVSVSKKLIYGLANITTKLYKTPYTITEVKTTDTTIIEGREVSQRDYWRLVYREKDNPRQQGHYKDDMLWMPIRELVYNEEFNDYVYNFEVEDDNSYVVYNLVVHNCQAFSVSGLREGFNDTRGTLFFEIARIAKEKQPKVLLLENVKGLINHDSGKTMRVMMDVLNEIGYRVDFDVLVSTDYGVPQARERIFIVAVRKDLVDNRGWVIRGNRVAPMAKRQLAVKRGMLTFNFDFPKGRETPLTIKDILEENVDKKYYVRRESAKKLIEELKSGNNLKKNTEVKKKKRSRGLFNKQVDDEGINIVGSLDQAGFESANRVYGIDGYSPTLVTGGDCFILESDPRIKVVGRINKGMSGLVYNVEGVSPTLNTGGEAMILEDKVVEDFAEDKDLYIRRLTPRESFRLQAFPENTFDILRDAGISESQMYKQAGNAVTLTVIDAIVRKIIEAGYLD